RLDLSLSTSYNFDHRFRITQDGSGSKKEGYQGHTGARLARPEVSKAQKLSPALDHLAATLVEDFDTFFFKTYKRAQSFLPCKLFGFDSIKGTKDIGDLIGGESMDGQLDMLYECVSEEFQSHIQEEAKYQDKLQLEMDRIRSLKKPRPTKQSLKPAEGHLISAEERRQREERRAAAANTIKATAGCQTRKRKERQSGELLEGGSQKGSSIPTKRPKRDRSLQLIWFFISC
ncbi:hypothetical protein PSTT_03160, partial [Puccinia striiformis]